MRVVLLALMAIGLASCGIEKTSEDHLARAKDYVTAADTRAAEIELKNALQLDAGSAEARYLLGKIYLDSDKNPAAEKELLRAQEMGWSADAVRPALAQALLAQGKSAQVLALQVDDLAGEGAAKLLSVQAIAVLLEGRREEAAALIAQARSSDPRSTDAILAQARLDALRGNMSDAFALIDQTLKREPESSAAWRLQAHMLWRQQKLPEARAAFDQSIALSSITFADHLSRALINLQLQDFAAAEEDVAVLAEVAPMHPGRNYVQGLLYFEDGQYRDSITALKRAHYASRKYPQLLYYLSLAYLLDGNLDLGARYAGEFVELVPDDIPGRKLLAAALFQQQTFGEALEALQPVLDYNPTDVAALNIKANILLLDEQADTALVLFAVIGRLRPQATVAELPLSAGLLSSGLGLGADASSALAATLDKRPEFPLSDVMRILERLQQQDFEQALAAADSYKWREPNELAPYNILGNVYMAAGQVDNARNTFEKALKRDPGNPVANLGLANMARDAGEAAQERQYYETVLHYHSGNLAALLRLAVLEGREGNDRDMVALLRRATVDNPTALEPNLGLARYYLDTGKPQKVAQQFSKLGPLQQRSPRVLELYALSQLAQQQYGSAYLALEELVAAAPDSAEVRFLLWQAAAGAGKHEVAGEALTQALALDAAQVPPLLAQDAHTNTFLGIIQNRIAAGREEESRAAMLQWIESYPSAFSVRLALSDSLLAANDLSGAREQYQEVLKLAPDNLLALNNLAWNLREEQPAQALGYIRRAVALAPENAAILDSLAVIEHLNGLNTQARATISRALLAAPGNMSMRYHQAMITAALGETEQAIILLQRLLNARAGDFPERAAAQQLLATLRG